MEYYFYIILIFAIILKLTLYLCWYQVRRNAAAREVRIIMPDGSTRYAVVADASGASRARATSEERQCLPQADSLSPYDNQGMVERPIQPRFMGSPQGSFPGPPPYLGGQPVEEDTGQWKLPKYEELEDAPPPYAPPTQIDNQGEVQGQSPTVTNQPPSEAPAIQQIVSPPYSYSMASAIPTIPAATGTMAPSYAATPTTSVHISAASALGRGTSPIVSPQSNTVLPQVVTGNTIQGSYYGQIPGPAHGPVSGPSE
ncbi:uncharacterized protein [Amphiura filiformis]|uniref:uncharacterized protein n=1 Tax=Amphiura filiformis TaxID=82378 RepID=UPI003B21A705